MAEEVPSHSKMPERANGQRVIVDLHTAVKEGNISQLEEHFKDSDGSDCDALNKDLHTPLYLACKEGNVHCVRIILKYDAKLKYEAEGRKFSCLFAAIDANKREVLAYILSLPKEKWIDGFRFCSECENSQNRNEEEITPLRKLIKKMPDMAKAVFDKLCERKSINDDYFYREVTYDYELLEDYQDLYTEFLQNGVTSNEKSSQQQVGKEKEKVEQFYNWGPKCYKYHTHPLYLMVHYKRKDLLAHELVSSFICMRWNMFLKYIYYFNLLTYIVLMLLLTVYVHVYFLYATKYADLTNQTLSNCSNDLDGDFDESILETQFPFMRILLIISAAVITVICLFRLFTELVQMLSNPRKYFTEFLNYAEIFLYFSTITFVANGDFTCLTGWRWQLGAFCIFVSWLNFVFFLSLQPNIGIYVIMFEEIIGTFLRVLPLAILLILAFGQPFFILLGPIIVESDPTTRPFSNLPYSLMKTLTMMIGEFETDHLLYSVPSILIFPVATYFLWIVFVLVVSILLQNLLVGLAVDNIKGIQKQAEFKRQVAQIRSLLTLMTPKPFKKLLGFCLRRHAKGGSGPREYKKTKGKLHLPLMTYIKHKSSSLVNFSWKPEETPTMMDSTSDKVKLCDEQVLDKLEQISRDICSLGKKIDTQLLSAPPVSQ